MYSSYSSHSSWPARAILVPFLLFSLGICAEAQEKDQKPIPGQRDFSDATVSSSLVQGRVHVIRVVRNGFPYNMAVMNGPEGALLVDHTDAPSSLNYESELDRLGVRKVLFLINTHWHYDHVGGNEVYGRDATIVAHENVRARLTTEQKPWWADQGIGPYQDHALPVLTYARDMTLHVNGETVHLWHFGPAHTDGDSIVYFKDSKVVHMGDQFHGRGQLAFGQSATGLLASYREVLSRVAPDSKLITGHGEISNPEDLAFFADMLEHMVNEVRKAMAAGKSDDEIKAIPVPEKFHQWWPGGKPSNEVTPWLSNILRGLKNELGGS